MAILYRWDDDTKCRFFLSNRWELDARVYLESLATEKDLSAVAINSRLHCFSSCRVRIDKISTELTLYTI